MAAGGMILSVISYIIWLLHLNSTLGFLKPHAGISKATG